MGKSGNLTPIMSQKRARASVGMSWHVFGRFPPLFCNFSFKMGTKILIGDYRRIFWVILDSPCQKYPIWRGKSKISEWKSVFTFFDPLRPKNIIFDRFYQLSEAVEWDLFHPRDRECIFEGIVTVLCMSFWPQWYMFSVSSKS